MRIIVIGATGTIGRATAVARAYVESVTGSQTGAVIDPTA